MPRPLRLAPGGYVYHVLNRANSRQRIFDKPADYRAFERVLAEVQERIPMRLLAWCVMPNHWHLVLWPRQDEQLSDYLRLVTLTHTQRWHAHHASAGSGHLYQGRFKSFVVQDDTHFLTVCRYVEANALRARLVARAEEWKWSSLRRTLQPGPTEPPRIEPWPVERPHDWMEYVNQAQTLAEIEAVRHSVRHGMPYGRPSWAHSTAHQLGLGCSLRPRGRPRKCADQDPKRREKGS